MKFKWDKHYLYWGITAFFVIVFSISFFIMLNNLSVVSQAMSKLVAILMPFIAGFVIAYLINPVLKFFEEKCFLPLLSKTKVKKPKVISRVLGITVSVTLGIAIVTMLLFLIIPQLMQSIEAIIKNIDGYFKNFQKWLATFVSNNPTLQSMLTEQVQDLSGTITDWASNKLMPKLDSILTNVTSGVIGILSFLKNLFIGLIISVYVLYSKEKFVAQSKKIVYSIFSVKKGNRLLEVTRRSDKIFGGFITGKLIDSLIIGLLCFVGMTAFRMPYPLLISVIIGVTNIIPFFGPFIGAIPSAMLILMIDPLQCLYFVIFILILQQFDGNILGPLILGDSTGLSAFWVIFAILLSGGLFGFTGMVIGVPAFAVIYTLVVEFSENRLKQKGLPTQTNQYADLGRIDPETGKMIAMEPIVPTTKTRKKKK